MGDKSNWIVISHITEHLDNPDSKIFELTYDMNKKEWYLDVYKWPEEQSDQKNY